MTEHATAAHLDATARGPWLGMFAGFVAAALIAGGAWWYFIDRVSTSGSIPASANAAATNGPHAATAAELEATARTLGHRVYWLGPKANMTYELTVTNAGLTYVRYLPAGTAVGTKQAKFVTVGSYPEKNAFSVLAAARKLKGAQVQEFGSNEIAVTYAGHPDSTYVAWKGSPFAVEVFDPVALESQTIVRDGIVKPVR